MATGGREGAPTATAGPPHDREAPADAARARRDPGRSPLPISIVLSLLVGVAGHHRPRSSLAHAGATVDPGSPSTPTGADRGLGRVRASDRQHARQDDAAPARWPGGRPGVQGRPVQHRRAGPIPDGRPRLGDRRRRSSRQPAVFAFPLALAAGMLGGAAWGFIPGFLKAVSGAHEVVTTIMLNFVALAILAAARQRTAERRRLARRRSPCPSATRRCPVIFGRNGTISIIYAPIMAVALSAGCCSGRHAASRSASPARALTRRATPACRPSASSSGPCPSPGMLGGHGRRDRPPGRHPPDDRRPTAPRSASTRSRSPCSAARARSGSSLAALLFGALSTGSSAMQIQAGVPAELVGVLQATILFFLVVSPVIKRIFRLKRREDRARGRRRRSRATYGGEATIR